MAACLMSASESISRRDNWVAEIIALPLGRAMSRGWRLKPAVLRRRDQRSRQGFPVGFARPSESGNDLVNCMLMAVMRYLRSWAPANKRRPQQIGRARRTE